MSDKNFKVKNGIDSTGPVTITTPNTSTTGLVINVPVGGKAVEFLRNGSYVGAIDDWGGLNTTQGINAAGFWFTRSPGIEAQSFFWAGSSTRSAAGFGGTSTGTNPVIYISSHSTGTNDLTQWLKPDNTIVAKVDYLGNITANDLTLSGNLTVNGTTTNLNSTNLIIEDKNIIIADVATPTDTTADGAGITIKGATDKTFSWVQSSGRFVSSEPVQSSAFIGTSNIYTPQLGSTVIGSATLNTNADTGGILINTAGASNKGFIVKGATSQTANLQEWQNSAGTVLTKIGSNGQVFINPSSASVTALTVKSSPTYPANLQEWQDSSGTILAQFRYNGSLDLYTISPFFNSGTYMDFTSSSINMNSRSTTTTSFVVKGAASQTANLQEWQNSAGTALATVSSFGSFTVNNLGVGGTLGATVRFIVTSSGAGNVVSMFRGAASQTADLQQWQDSSATVLASISSAGKLTSAVDASINGLTFGLGASAVSSNVAAGSNALATNSTGSNNSALGYQALYLNTTGAGNSAFGYISLTTNTSGYNNSAFGTQSLTGNTTGINNTAIGAFVLKSNTTGSDNSSFGINSLFTNTTGAENTAIGANSLYLNTIGIGNSAFGKNSLYSNTTGSSNVGIGYSSIYANTTGSNHVAVGYQALYSNTSGIENSVLGYQALYANTTGSGNTGFGTAALYFNTGGYNNTAVASKALYSNTNGIQNVAIGQRALYTNTTGGNNTAIGMQSGYLNVTGSSSVFIGYQAGYNETGSNKLYIANTDTATPLIGGDFSAKTLTVAGNATVVSQAAATQGLIIKGAASQTGDLQQWQDVSGSTRVAVSSYGTLFSYTEAVFSNQLNGNGTALLVKTNNAGGKPLIVQGATSQTANLQEWQNSAGLALARIKSNGNTVLLAALTVNQSNTLEVGDNAGIGSFEVKGTSFLTPRAATGVGLIVRGFASQTANLQEWQNSSGTVLTSVRYDGSILITKNGDPATGVAAPFMSSPVNSGYSSAAVYSFWYQSGTGISNPYAQTLGINTNSIERMRFTSDGLVLINSSSSTLGGGSVASQLGVVIAAATTVGAVIRGQASQTANLQEWQNSSGTALAKVDANGNFSAISKSFDIAHPTKENMRLRYASLEGPENGVYIRGTVESNIIELPEYWTGLVHEDSITVSLTAVGSAQNIYVEKIENNKVYIGGELTKAFFTVYGERKDIDNLVVEY